MCFDIHFVVMLSRVGFKIWLVCVLNYQKTCYSSFRQHIYFEALCFSCFWDIIRHSSRGITKVAL